MVGREELTPTEVINHAVNVRTPITVTITGMVYDYESRDGEIEIVIADRPIKLTTAGPWVTYANLTVGDPRVVVSREAIQ